MKAETIEKIFNFLEETEGKEIPENFKLIKELENYPDGVQYKHEGDLDLSLTNIKKLPNDLYVGDDLILYGCKELKEFPDKLYVGGDLYLNHLNIKKLPNDLYVKGTLILNGCKKLIELPNNLYVGRRLYIYGTPLADNYTDEEIRKIVASTGGIITDRIHRYMN
jgi:hypothetical protein